MPQSQQSMAATDASAVQGNDQHIDLHGNVFNLPDYTMKQIHDAIPAHCFQPSIVRSMAYVVRDFVYFSVLAYATSYIQYVPSLPVRIALWTAYTVLQGMVMTGIWILAHECGHGAFSKNKQLNNVMGLLMHSFLLVPYHSWRITHSAHHKATGNIERDTAFVPHLREDWVKTHCGEQADHKSVELSHLAEDAPIVTLWTSIVHQLLGWPGYLFLHLTGQRHNVGAAQKTHFYFGEDSPLFKKEQLPLIMLSDLGIVTMIAALTVAGQLVGSWNMVLIYMIPYLWVNHWIVAITFLQHTDGTLPHYNNSTWTFARGATATIDRNLGFIDTHLFHDIIGTHVLHHLISTIPFYHAGEASEHIKKVMGPHYRADTTTPFMVAFWKSQRTCKFVEESVEGSGVYMFRNLHGAGAKPKDLTGGKAEGFVATKTAADWRATEKKEKEAAEEKRPSAMSTAMSSSRNMEAKRRFSSGLQAKALPLLAE